jgi:glycine betaine/proline transport system ATP-binding protein
MGSPVIEIQGLYKLFGEHAKQHLARVKAGDSKEEILSATGHTLGLKDINLSINAGEIFVIMGLSGSGKSTLIRHFNRLIDPTEGKVVVEGQDIMALNARQLRSFRQRKMSMVFQRFGLLPHYTVLDNVAFGLEAQSQSKQQRLASARQWLETVGLSGYEDQYPAQLSGGQQQRVGLARALCTDAEILLMDEAFSALDPLIRSEMQDQLIELQGQLKKTIVFITHDLDEALKIGDRIAILRDGELVQVGKPADILLQPADDYVEKFVRDVNRARALTVAAVMQPAEHCIAGATLDAASAYLHDHDCQYVHCLDGVNYQGTLTRAQLARLTQSGVDEALGPEHFEAHATVAPNAVLEEVIAPVLGQDIPLAVVDDGGRLCGQLCRADVVQVLARMERED